MSQSPENSANEEKEKKQENQQTEELKNMLIGLKEGLVPKIRSTKPEAAVVTTPSFLQDKETSQSQFPLTDKPSETSTSGPTASMGSVGEVSTEQEGEEGIDIVQAKAMLDKFVEQEPVEIIAGEKPTGNFFPDMGIFFQQLGRTYKSRYTLWEKTFISIMAILKKIRAVNEGNTLNAIHYLELLEEKLKLGLDEFQQKRTNIEQYAHIEYKQIINQFKKTLELLNFQLREFRLQQEINELYHIFAQ